jgi:hypothetical protein
MVKKLYHGTDNPKLTLSSVKDGFGYHPGAGPVEFLGLSFSTSKEVAASYGKNIIEREFIIKKPKKFRSMNALRENIIKTFSLPQKGQSVAEHYRDIADSYKVKLQAEGYDAVIFPEGLKGNIKEKIAETVIPILEEFIKKSDC